MKLITIVRPKTVIRSTLKCTLEFDNYYSNFKFVLIRKGVVKILKIRVFEI